MRRSNKREGMVSYELVPPLQDVPGMEPTAQLFTFLSRIIGRRSRLSLEIISSRSQGIRFVIRVPYGMEGAVLAAVAAYMPGVKTVPVEAADHPEVQGNICEYQQTGHFAYPLKRFDELGSNDPMAYITAAMTKLRPDEEMAMQIICKPVRLAEARRLSARLLQNAVLGMNLRRQSLPAVAWLGRGINSLLFTLLDMIAGVTASGTTEKSIQWTRRIEEQRVREHRKPARSLSLFEQELLTAVHDKLAEPHFQVSLRTRVVTRDRKAVMERQSRLSAALAAYATSQYQSIQPKRYYLPVQRKWLADRYRRRLVNKRRQANLILGASELAALYHFPHFRANRTENIITSLSKHLPAPVSLKSGEPPSVLIGENHYHGQITPIGLTEALPDRRHF